MENISLSRKCWMGSLIRGHPRDPRAKKMQDQPKDDIFLLLILLPWKIFVLFCTFLYSLRQPFAIVWMQR
ncbi:MAG: hypothetical protein MI725_13085, partial [Pirellulales bacterium]|nr:hypothetical protein [Pirellulales bacterium]